MTPDVNSIAHFDAKAKQWDIDPVKQARARAVAEAMRERLPLPRESFALEYGCGTGMLSFELQPYLGHIALADNSAGMLDVLTEKIAAISGDNMHPILLDLATDPMPQERYDLIYSLMTFHHIKDTNAMLGKLHALLSPGGHLCIADLDAEDGSFHGHEFAGHKGFDRSVLASQAEHAGFNNVDFTTVFRMMRRHSPGQTEYPIFLMIAKK